MTIETNDFQSRLSVLLGLQGEVLTDEELSHTAERYARCGGKDHWDVREYVRRTGVGAREYRVVRGSSIEDVYRSVQQVRAAAVGTALNELDFPGNPRMTRRKQPWGQQRGWIVPADGSPPQELPQQMVGHKLISWPGTRPEKDYYHRHVLNPEGVSVYVPEGRDAESLPESITNEIRRQLKGES